MRENFFDMGVMLRNVTYEGYELYCEGRVERDATCEGGGERTPPVGWGWGMEECVLGPDGRVGWGERLPLILTLVYKLLPVIAVTVPFLLAFVIASLIIIHYYINELHCTVVSVWCMTAP